MIRYGVQAQLATYVDQAYRRVVSEGLVEPLADKAVKADEKVDLT